MAFNSYSHGKGHTEEMAESRIHGTTRSSSNRRRNSARGNHLASSCEYGLGRPGETPPREVSQTESGIQRESQFHSLRRRFSDYRRLERTSRKGGEAARGAIHGQKRTHTLPRENRHYTH